MYFFFNGVVFVLLYVFRIFTTVFEWIKFSTRTAKSNFFFVIPLYLFCRKGQTCFYPLTIASKGPRCRVVNGNVFPCTLNDPPTSLRGLCTQQLRSSGTTVRFPLNARRTTAQYGVAFKQVSKPLMNFRGSSIIIV